MKKIITSLLILASLVMTASACRDANSSEESTLAAVDGRNRYTVKGRSGRNYYQEYISVTNDRAFYPICPSGSPASDIGVTVQASRVVYSTNDNTHWFLWMKSGNSGYSQARNICNVLNNTRSQFAQQGGCTCVRKK